jgi:polyketide synthase PksN
MEYTKSSYVIQAVIQTISSLQKAGQKEVRILEIGAGTGGTTRGVLDAIFKQSDVQDLELKYSYTDVSNFFLTKAEAIFVPQYPKVTFDFSVLDIELPNAEQGAFAIRTGENGYDMIIAADVFHVTKYLEDTLEHTRALLKPGGLLILGELFTGNASLELTFGLADGWWRFSDGIRTKGSPLINSDEWEVNLRKSGFVNTFSVCVCEGYSGVVFGFADDKTS